MYQPWIFATVTAAGAGLVALTVTLQRPPTVPHQPLNPSDPIGVKLVPPKAVEIVEPQPDPAVELEPIVIRAPLKQRFQPAQPPEVEPASVFAEKPCSDWRELGPTHVVAGTPSGDLRVRALCQ
jgi:hypothetical protein